MCLAIYKPQGIQISKRYLRNGFEGNNDGAGFAYASKGTIVIRKGFFSFADFMQAYKPHQNKPCVIHFRMTTHGATNEKNCHPFALCGQKYALVHNGILDIEQSEDKGMSDTWHFAELILTPMLSVHSPDKPSFRYLVESTIGNGNKLVIMDASGKATIYNEKAGEWHKGCWFSNSGYLFDRRSFWTSWDYSKKASKEASKGRGYITLLNGKVQEGPSPVCLTTLLKTGKARRTPTQPIHGTRTRLRMALITMNASARRPPRSILRRSVNRRN